MEMCDCNCETCVDMDVELGVVDRYGTGCEYYENHPHACGMDDTDEFRAKELCCACSYHEAPHHHPGHHPGMPDVFPWGEDGTWYYY